MVDVVIIGAGPAGLTAAQYCARSNLTVQVIEQLAPGGQAVLIETLENYPGNIASAGRAAKSGFELAQDMHQQAERFGARIMIDTVQALYPEAGDLWTAVLASNAELHAKAVILATGARHKTLGIPGEKEFTGKGVSYCAPCDGPFFKGKKILVIGGGDSACDEAHYLSGLTPHVILIHRRGEFRAQKALVERVLNNPCIEVRYNSRLLAIRGEQVVSGVVLETDTKQHEESADAVFVFVGAVPENSLVPSARCDSAGYILTDQEMASSVPGLFVAGDVRSSPFRQIITAAGDGAIAAHSAIHWCQSHR
jgi:thioredoxin reductase (NADPH)